VPVLGGQFKPVLGGQFAWIFHSLANKLNNAQLKNLTEITYEEGYYDQSYLIKEFRKITNHNPKDFFKSASKVDGDKIIWEIK